MVGLYAALAFAVGQRTREIAIRMALGAARLDVGRLVLARGAVIVLVGLSLGLAAAAIAGPLFSHLLYGVSAGDPMALLTGPSMLAPISLLAMWMPARPRDGAGPDGRVAGELRICRAACLQEDRVPEFRSFQTNPPELLSSCSEDFVLVNSRIRVPWVCGTRRSGRLR